MTEPSNSAKVDFPQEGDATRARRQAIMEIQRDQSLAPAEKARKIQSLMSGKSRSQPAPRSSASIVGAQSSNSDDAYSRRLKAKMQENERKTKPAARAQSGSSDDAYSRRLNAKMQESERSAKLTNDGGSKVGASASSKADAYDRRLKAKMQENEKPAKPKAVHQGLDDFEKRMKSKMEQNDRDFKPSATNVSSAGGSPAVAASLSAAGKTDFPQEGETTLTRRQAILAIQRDQSLSAAEKAKKIQYLMSGKAGSQPAVRPSASSVGAQPSSSNDAYSMRLKAKMQGSERAAKPNSDGESKVGVSASSKADAYDMRLKAKMRENEQPAKPKSAKGLDDFEKRLKSKIDQNEHTTKPKTFGASDYDKRLKAKLQDNEQPSKPMASNKGDEYDRRLKAKMQENEQVGNGKATGNKTGLDDFEKRLKSKMAQNERTTRPKTYKADDYDQRLKAKMNKNNKPSRAEKGLDNFENRLKSKMSQNDGDMRSKTKTMKETDPEQSSSFYDNKFSDLTSKYKNRAQEDEDYFNKLNKKLQENEHAAGLNSAPEKSKQSDISHEKDFGKGYVKNYENEYNKGYDKGYENEYNKGYDKSYDNEYNKGYDNHYEDEYNPAYDERNNTYVERPTVTVADHGRAVAPEPQFGQAAGIPVIGGAMGDDQLAIAIAVEEEEEDLILGSAIMYDPTSKPPIFKNRRFRLYAFSGFCVCLAATALIITSILLFREKPEGPEMIDEKDAGTIWLEEMESKQINVERWFIQFNAVVESAKDTKSMAHRAARWIISEDKMELKFNAPNLIQRYLLALFYITTTKDGEKPWRSCNKPEGNESDVCQHLRFNRLANDTIDYDEVEATRWLSGKHECDWVGNICDDNKKLRALHIMGQNITGTIPEDLVSLSLLQSLRLAYNNFTGTLPTIYASMRQLLSLEVHGNELNGTFPSEYFSATLLQTLNILDNKFNGTISSDIQKLTNLKGLHIGNNFFTGTIPAEIFELEYLSFLQLQDNVFTGTLPTEVGNMPQLQEFRAESNQLTGTLPSEIGLMTNLVDFRVSWNKMTGTLPLELYDISYLGNLNIFSNYFNGTIDPKIQQLSDLKYLYLSRNEFTGDMSPVKKLGKLRLAWLHLNRFEGTVPEELCNKAPSVEVLQSDCFPLKTPVTPCKCCTSCCNRNTELCLILDDELTYDFY